jgi:hypothetical protein
MHIFHTGIVLRNKNRISKNTKEKEPFGILKWILIDKGTILMNFWES